MYINIDEQITPPTQLSFAEAIQVDNLFIKGKLTHLELGYVATPQHQSRFQVIYFYHLYTLTGCYGR